VNPLAPRPDGTYQMPETVQYTTLIIALAVVAVVFFAFKFLWDDWVEDWARDDLDDEIQQAAEELYVDRDQHHDDVRDALLERWSA
jgi:hypothetical protein